jgi:hypothetical protein
MSRVNGVAAELVGDWELVVSAQFQADGYLVVGFRREREIGSVELNLLTKLPFRIIGEATYADALRQFARLVELTNCGEEPLPPPEGYKFYKTVVADRFSD